MPWHSPRHKDCKGYGMHKGVHIERIGMFPVFPYPDGTPEYRKRFASKSKYKCRG